MRARNILLAAVMVAAVLAVPSPAWAEPSGCSHTTPDFMLDGPPGSYEMSSDSSGSCGTSAWRTFRVEIKQDKAWAPDPVVGGDDDYYYGTFYVAAVRTCDKGNHATYYGRSFFTSSPTYKDTAHYLVETCS